MSHVINKLPLYVDLFRNMGSRYVGFRLLYALKLKLGFHKKRFPVNPPNKTFISVEDWRNSLPRFFFKKRNDINLKKNQITSLKERVDHIKKGKFIFFGRKQYHLDEEDSWITNPDNGYKYDIKRHWTEIQDLSEEAGDIKFVWEKARFSWVYDLIRYDYHFTEDQSEFVLSQLEDFIDKNPINLGPNYRCSQEISLRILNWTYVLYYYQKSEFLDEHLFQKIMNSIYWQLQHVYDNINFSRIAVRNNHAITETLMLFLSGLLFPFMPETKTWSRKGKNWFEKEIAYQIYDDGTFLQFSMNYHRVAVQLLTWGIRLADLHNKKFNDIVYERARKSIVFLTASMDPASGKLPNYGNNDGALFFKLDENGYRDYRSQLNDLRVVLEGKSTEFQESLGWYGFSEDKIVIVQNSLQSVNIFEDGGYYIIQENDSKTFLRCGAYKDRPGQADNNHLDIWHKGINYLRDAGSYKYNTSPELVQFFMGTKGHNTVSLGGMNQMHKSGRFIWNYWIKKADVTIDETEESYTITGRFKGFKTVGKNIWHQRKVTKFKGSLQWVIEDTFKNASNISKEIYWHLNPVLKDNLEIQITDSHHSSLKLRTEEGWYSSYYGEKESSPFLTAESRSGFITTIKILLD